MENAVFRLHEGWFCIVAGRTFGPWPLKGYAEAGLAVEQRRHRARAQPARNMSSQLDWWRGSNGSLFADYVNTRYCIAWQRETGFVVAANGDKIGMAQQLDAAKDIAEKHLLAEDA